jgi:serine/threonine protein kinase
MTFKLPFESTNQNESKALSNVKLEFPNKYSRDLQEMIKSMLFEDPFLRPGLKKILDHPKMFQKANHDLMNKI